MNKACDCAEVLMRCWEALSAEYKLAYTAAILLHLCCKLSKQMHWNVWKPPVYTLYILLCIVPVSVLHYVEQWNAHNCTYRTCTYMEESHFTRLGVIKAAHNFGLHFHSIVTRYLALCQLPVLCPQWFRMTTSRVSWPPTHWK